MRRLAALALGLLAIGGAAVHSSHAVPNPQDCGLSDTPPLWIDYADGQVPFWQQIFAHPGVIAAASKLIVPPQLRAAGAQTVYFDLDFNNRVGTPTNPADPSLMTSRADKFYAAAAASTGCANPYIALNELFGAQTPTPWSQSVIQYRTDISQFLTELRADGAHPFLLLSQAPYTANDAGAWLRQISSVADLVPEVYFNGRVLAKLGDAAAARTIRSTLRTRVEQLISIGIPTSRIGFMLTFSSTPGAGGREGVQPLSRWLDIVQLEVAGAKTVAAELHIATIWSWGWGTFSSAGADPDKEIVACVYLWARDPTLCDAPALAGSNLVNTGAAASTPTAGQICVLGPTPILANDVADLTSVTGDRDVAFSAAFERLVLDQAAQLGAGSVAAAERDVITEHFAGSRTAYLAALRTAHASTNLAHAVIGDQLRRLAVERTLAVSSPTAAQMSTFYSTYAAQPARRVVASQVLGWLGGKSGLALSATAPPNLFTLPAGATVTLDGVEITVSGPAAPLGVFPFGAAQRSIRAALFELARGRAFDAWVANQEANDLGNLNCTHDQLPQAAPVDLTDYLPFLSLG
jgi:hypothetical protein